LIHAADAPQSRFTQQDLRGLWPTFRMAQEMGEGVGRGEILLRPVPRGGQEKQIHLVD
jgi:hypothetical protein